MCSLTKRWCLSRTRRNSCSCRAFSSLFLSVFLWCALSTMPWCGWSALKCRSSWLRCQTRSPLFYRWRRRTAVSAGWQASEYAVNSTLCLSIRLVSASERHSSQSGVSSIAASSRALACQTKKTQKPDLPLQSTLYRILSTRMRSGLPVCSVVWALICCQ